MLNTSISGTSKIEISGILFYQNNAMNYYCAKLGQIHK